MRICWMAIVGMVGLTFVNVVAAGSGQRPPSSAVPDLSGHWILVPDPKGGDIAAGGTGVVIERRPTMEFTLTQDAKSVTMTRPGPNGEVKSVVHFDATENKNDLVGKWDAGKLVVVNKREMDGSIVTFTTSRWLEGALLKVEVKSVEEPAGGGPPEHAMVNLATYKKAGGPTFANP